jgi:hypothetical protein
LGGICPQFRHDIFVVFDEDRLMTVLKKQLCRFPPHASTTGNE